MKPAISIEGERIHRLRTPEGLSLPFVVGAAWDRLAAFVIDMLIVFGATVVVWILVGLTSAGGRGGIGLSFGILASFLLWNFYFVFCEVHWGGITAGKRRAGLRVIARDGGPLRAEAVFVRNLMRNLEFFLPAVVLLAPQQTLPESPGWGRPLSAFWIFFFALMPLFNRDRLRCGDLVAGTMVVRRPQSLLLSDLAAAPAPGAAARRDPAAAFAFSREQLAIYGIQELQVLEDLLRRHDQGTLEQRILDEVCEKIKLKIGWPDERWRVPVRPFLEAFYRAQRGHLEGRLLFGQRRESKRG
jgi:uncharacterized RDD family membrane protein YckC